MAVQDNWLANLRALIDAHSDGDDMRAGLRAVSAASGLSEEYLYQLYTGRPNTDGSPRNVGPRAAKALARAFGNGRPADWFDTPPHQPAPKTGAPQPNAPMAQMLSHLSPTMLRIVTWETLMQGEPLPEVFILKAPDDALAPDVRAGAEIIWSTAKKPKLGSPIIVRDRRGHIYMRRLHEGVSPGHFVAASLNPAYRTLDSDEHGLQLVAVWHGRIGDYE